MRARSRHACVLPPLRLLGLIVVGGLSFLVMPSTAVYQKHGHASERALLTNSTLCDDRGRGHGEGDDMKVPGAVPKLADMEHGKLQLSSVTTAVLMLLDNGGLSDTLHSLGKSSERLGRITTLRSPCRRLSRTSWQYKEITQATGTSPTPLRDCNDLQGHLFTCAKGL
jgi:hypothetical protein